MLYRLLTIEFIKTRKNIQLWLFLLIPSIIVLLFFFLFIGKEVRHLNYYTGLTSDPNPWNFYFSEFLFYFPRYYPILIAIFMVFLVNIEHKANAWKHIFTLPVSKTSVFSAKFLIAFFYITFGILISYPILISSSLCIKSIKPDFFFSQFNNNMDMVFILMMKAYICSFGVIAFHFWLSILFKNQLTLSIFIPILSQLTNFDFLPHNLMFSTHALIMKLKFTLLMDPGREILISDISVLGKFEIFSLIYSIIFGLIGFYYMNRKSQFY